MRVNRHGRAARIPTLRWQRRPNGKATTHTDFAPMDWLAVAGDLGGTRTVESTYRAMMLSTNRRMMAMRTITIWTPAQSSDCGEPAGTQNGLSNIPAAYVANSIQRIWYV